MDTRDSIATSSFGETVQTFRKRQHLTQQALASKLGVHRNTIGMWERGDFLPESRGIVLELARHLHLDDQQTRHLLEASLTALAPHWVVPYLRNPFFTGREMILDTLSAHLRTDQTIALTQSYALHGLGGIGKTQIALEYAYRHALEYTAIFWIWAESVESIIASFLDIAELLQLPERNEADQQQMIAAVQHWLSIHSQWLLIWDNLEEIELLQRFLPPTRQGTILITTRSQSLGTLAQGIELMPMGVEEGKWFLLRRAKLLSPQATSEQMHLLQEQTPTEYAAAEELVKLMDGLPLALDQVGAYIEETGCSLSDYLQHYEKRRQQLLDRRGAPGETHPHSVVATLSLACERVEQHHPAAVELLRFCAFLQPDAIPEEMIVAATPFLGAILQPVAADPYLLDLAIAALRTFSLVQRHRGTHTLSLHRLVQAMIRDSMDAATAHCWMKRVVQAVNHAFPDGQEAETWPQCQRALPHAEVCKHYIEEEKLTFTEARRLLHQAGVYLRERAQYVEAEQWLARARDLRIQVLGPEDLEVTESLHHLAELYRTQSNYPEAERLYLEALTIQERQGKAAHLQVAETLHRLAFLHWLQGRYAEAEPLCRRALQLRESLLGSEHPKVASTLNDLAMICSWTRGRYKEAELLYQQALAIREQHFGPQHPEVADSLINLASLYVDQGRYEEPEPLLRRALSIWEQHLGPEHPEVANTWSALARLYGAQGRYTEAEALYKRAISVREHFLGPEHNYVAYSLNGLAKVYGTQGKYTEAEALYRRALRIWDRHLGPRHLNIAKCFEGLAELYVAQRRYEEAELLYRQAWSIREQQLGADHPDTARSRAGLATLYQRQGRCEEAKLLYQQALFIYMQWLGPDHPDTVQAMGDYTVCDTEWRSKRELCTDC